MTLQRLRQEENWANMAKDAETLFHECLECQISLPNKPTVVNLPVGVPLHMITVYML